MQSQSQQPMLAILWLRLLFIVIILSAISTGQPFEFDHARMLESYILLGLLVVVQIGTLLRLRHAPYIGELDVFSQCLFDTLMLTLVFLFSGGVTNAFASFLLLPIVIAGLSLPLKFAIINTLFVIFGYLLLLLTLNEHQMHRMDWYEHVLMMGANFISSTIIMMSVIVLLVRKLSARERSISEYTRQQQRSEQLISMGVASAQVTHQIATPLATLQLLLEEVEEDESSLDVSLLKAEIDKLTTPMSHFRSLSHALRDGSLIEISVSSLFQSLQEAVNLYFPAAMIDWSINNEGSNALLVSPMITPALLNLVHNAISSSSESQKPVSVTFNVVDQLLTISVVDQGTGFIELSKRGIGVEFQPSEEGSGIGLVLSNHTFNDMNAALSIQNHKPTGTLAKVTMQLKDQ